MAGANTTTTNPADFTNRLQKYFSRKLLDPLKYELRLASYGWEQDLPANSASNTIRFFRPRKAKKSSTVGGNTTGPQALTEGVAPTNQNTVSVGFVDVALAQRGDVVTISDIVRAVDLFNTLEIYTKTLGADAALDMDFVCSRAICAKPGQNDADGTPTNVGATQVTMYNSNTSFERFAGVANTLNSANDFATLSGNTTANSKITRANHLGMVTRLRGLKGSPRAPMINGRYVALLAPEVFFDLRQDATWIAAAVYDAAKLKSLYKWAEFELDGAVFVENQSAFIENNTYGTYDNTGATPIFSNIYLGEQAFGVPKLGGKMAGSDPRQPSMIVLPNADKADPLGQVTSIGWKAYYQAALLLTTDATDTPHLGILRTKSTMV